MARRKPPQMTDPTATETPGTKPAERYKTLTELLIDEYLQRLSRSGPDGMCYRSFIADWLYFERPMIDRFIGAEFNVQFEGPPVRIGGDEYPLGGFIERQIQWTRIIPEEAFALRQKLREVVDQTVCEWMDGRDFEFVPAIFEKPFADRAAADAEAERQIRAFARPLPDFGEGL